ncbi:MAG: hypothetical protein R3F14_28145 [Polyangiaceae bacterium]
MPIHLYDLEEASLAARDSVARKHYAEAVACYHAGALRAAVVSLWTACVLDIVAKLRELALTGDKAAEQQLADFEKMRVRGDVQASLSFEQGILELARDKFELLTRHEMEDLERLRLDRHRCAHPSMNTSDEPYQPSPELVRYHFRSAANHLLMRPPVQGKTALASLFQQIESDYFPTAPEPAYRILSHGALARAKGSLIRNFLVASLKVLVSGTHQVWNDSFRRIEAAIQATLQLHPAPAREIIGIEFPGIARAVADANLLCLLRAVEGTESLAAAMPEDLLQRMRQYLARLPVKDKVPAVFIALMVPSLREDAAQVAATLTTDELADGIKRSPSRVRRDDPLVDRALALYLSSTSFESANTRAQKVILPIVSKLSVAQVSKILAEARNHSELSGAHTTRTVLQTLRDANIIPIDEFNKRARDGALRQTLRGPFPAEPQAAVSFASTTGTTP